MKKKTLYTLSFAFFLLSISFFNMEISPNPNADITALQARTMASRLNANFNSQQTKSKQQLNDAVPFNPQNRPITPFGYGNVRNTMSPANNSLSGQSICQAQFGSYFNCVEVTGTGQNNFSCDGIPPQNSVISCYQALTKIVNEDNFQPVSCGTHETGSGNWSPLLTSLDWCNVTGYMPNRSIDSFYQFSDFTRLGVNTMYGGTVFELYGVDKIDRIMQNGGGATQLSVWGVPSVSTSSYFLVSDNNTSCDPTPYTLADCEAKDTLNCNINNVQGQHTNCCQLNSYGGVGALSNVSNCGYNVPKGEVAAYGCSGNGWSAAGPFNPIQAISGGCNYNQPSGAISAIQSPESGYVTVTKLNPNHFTKSDQLQGLTWSQTSHVVGPYADLKYSIVYNGSISMGSSDQEIPAIFSHGAIGSYVYYYDGTSPYRNSQSSVLQQSVSPGENISFMLPGATMYAPNPQNVTENWISLCDQSQTECLTVASFSPVSQVIAFGFSNNSQTDLTQDNSYLGIHGHFPIQPGLNVQAELFIFPYRFDDVVSGQTVREWIYALHAGKSAPKGLVNAEKAIGNVDGFIQGSSVSGWACISNEAQPVKVLNVYAGDPNQGGVLVASGSDAFPSEPAVGNACNSTGNRLRFEIPLSPSVLSNYAGLPLYVTATGSNTVIANSGHFTIPIIYQKGGFSMTAGQTPPLKLPNNWSLSYQNSDGNLVVYQPAGSAQWAAGFTPKFLYPNCETPNKCVVQFQGSDGNLVAYANGSPYWATGTNNPDNPSKEGQYLVISNQAPYLSVYDQYWDLLWASNGSN